MKPYKDFAIEMAREAGQIIRTNFMIGMKKEWKADSSPVTETDLAINHLLIERVQDYYPDYSIIGEEESYNREGAEYAWVCDPVDGTAPFSHGIPTCVFSLALVFNGVPILGVIYDPFMDRLFFAEKGKGATLNGSPITVANTDSLESRLVGLEATTVARGELAKAFKVEKAKCFTLHCVMYEGMLVACGEFAAVVFMGKGCHDGASLKIIVEEAGGKVTDIHGEEQRYDQAIDGFIASNGILHDTVLEIVSKIII